MQTKLAFYPSCGQALQLADKGFYDLEAAREKLYFFANKYGLSNPLTLRQSRIVDNLILLQMNKKCI